MLIDIQVVGDRMDFDCPIWQVTRLFTTGWVKIILTRTINSR